MAHRWIIRGFFLTLLLLCVGAWVASYRQSLVLSYSRAWNDAYTVGIYAGFAEVSNSGSTLRGWDFDCDSEDPLNLPAFYPKTKYHYGGFGYCPNFFNMWPGKGWIILCPLWFPTTLSGLLLCLVWRKTRAPVMTRGFPVVLPAPNDP